MKRIVPAKGERIEFRVSNEFKTLFDRAAEVSGVSLTAFVTEATRQRAMAVIEQYERLVLNNKARDMLLNALSNHPAPGIALRRAAKKFAVK